MSLRYIMTTHRNRPGVRLSKPGHWGNVPCIDELDAHATAAADANGRPFTIEREHFTKELRP